MGLEKKRNILIRNDRVVGSEGKVKADSRTGGRKKKGTGHPSHFEKDF